MQEHKHILSLAVLTLALLPVSPATAADAEAKLCLNQTSTNWVKFIRGEQRALDRFPHVFLTVEKNDAILDSAGFYYPASLHKERIEDYQVKNGASKRCVPLPQGNLDPCLKWIARARADLDKLAENFANRGPAPVLASLEGAPPPPEPAPYRLLFNNCANFVKKAWYACSGDLLADRSWVPRVVSWPPALEVPQ